jgi:indole-3-glycerol phosphate synthase
MIDEYQFYEAKSIGADVILLIAACLSPTQVRNLQNWLIL